MYNITITYDPLDTKVAVPDGVLDKVAKDIVDFAMTESLQVITSTWSLVEWIRAEICSRNLEPEKVTVLHEGNILHFDKYGNMIDRPNDFPVNSLYKTTVPIVEFIARRQEVNEEEMIEKAMAQADKLRFAETPFECYNILLREVPVISLKCTLQAYDRIFPALQ